MRPGLQPGAVASLSEVVTAERAIVLGQETAAPVAVYCTPAMIYLMELAAREALKPFLEPGEESVGAAIEVQHTAPTMIGATATAVATVTAIEKREITFTVEARDELGVIGRGVHRRAVIRLERLEQAALRRARGDAGNEATQPSDRARDASAGSLPMSTSPERPAAYGSVGPLPAWRTLLADRNGEVLTVLLNRPQQLNCVDSVMTAEFEQLVAWLAAAGDAVRVVIFGGAGRAFCAGDDLKEVATLDVDSARQLSLRQARMYLALETLPQPIIAAIQGPALGGGCVLAYSCDLRIATHAATFGMPEIRVGWTPGYGLSQLMATVGKARALEMCLTGETMTAATALGYGLVHQLVPSGQLMDAARKLAAKLVSLPAAAVRDTKRLIHRHEGSLPKQTYWDDTAAYIEHLQTADAREGLQAFREKRPPRFGATS